MPRIDGARPPRPRARLAFAGAVLATLAACAADAPGAHAVSPEFAPAAKAAPSDTKAPAARDDASRVLVDMRAPSTEPDALDDAEQRRVLALALPGGATPDARVQARADGAFTAPGTRQVAWLVLPHGARAIAPADTPALLLVTEGNRVVARAPVRTPYVGIAGHADVDGNGTDDLLLLTWQMQMGRTRQTIDAVSLRGAAPRVLRTFDDVATMACGTAPDAAATAAVLSLGANGLQRRDYRAPCPADGEPAPADYRPVAPAAAR